MYVFDKFHIRIISVRMYHDKKWSALYLGNSMTLFNSTLHEIKITVVTQTHQNKKNNRFIGLIFILLHMIFLTKKKS